jgi:hypothetical protein
MRGLFVGRESRAGAAGLELWCEGVVSRHFDQGSE